ADLDFFAVDVQPVCGVFLLGDEWNPGWREHGRAHVDSDLSVVLEARRNHTGKRLDADLALVGEVFVAYVAQKTARTVAAMLHLIPVSIEDAIEKVRVGRSRTLDQKNLIAPDAEMTV